jgi:pyruvate, water dikinase
LRPRILILALSSLLLSCGSGEGQIVDDVVVDYGQWTDGECTLVAGEELPDYVEVHGCQADFEGMATRPLDGSIPGARSAKIIWDTFDDTLYFLNADKYPIHYYFCLDHLGIKNGKPPVPDLGTFNKTEYYSPYRRFWLGAITFYEGPQVWTYEIAPYDTSSAEMVGETMKQISNHSFFGDVLHFHPTSEGVSLLVKDLPDQIPVVTTDALYKGVTFLPLNPGESFGQLRFLKVADLMSGKVFVTPRDVVVLDQVPNDIPVVAGIITDELQTPLAHINVLSQNRGTPNMSLAGAMDDPALRALEGKWVKFTVDPFDYSVEKSSKAAADAWWSEHKPPPVTVATLDLSVTDLRDVEDLTVDDIAAFGGKASHFGELYRIPDLRTPDGFAIPVHYYKEYEKANGFDVVIGALLASEKFQNDIAYREVALAALRSDMEKGWFDPAVELKILNKIGEKLPGIRLRFRSSTNAEDLDGFTGAGLYTSKSGQPGDPKRPITKAIRKVYASLWNQRAFEERSFRGIDHQGVGMAILVHRSFPNETSNGVALTNNIFDPVQSAFYINAQVGDTSVVRPPLGILPDQFLYFYGFPNQPITYLAHSNMVAEGESVLSLEETRELGKALQAIHSNFASFYKQPGKFYAMDIEFKFDWGWTEEKVYVSLCEEGDEDCGLETYRMEAVYRNLLWVKQARPHYGWSANPLE